MGNIVNDLLNGTHKISEMMKTYLATPWCECQKGQWKSCVECDPPRKTKEEQGNQSHGGDLFQHSQWSALYLTKWYLDNNTKYTLLHNLLIEIINSNLLKTIIGDDKNKVLEFVQACGFFHDICKGGDGIFDMYASNKYGKGTSDSIHPEICSNVIIDPKNQYDGLLKTTLDEILKGYQDPINARIILSLCAATHWEFGKLNYNFSKESDDYKKYIKENAPKYIKFILDQKNKITQHVTSTYGVNVNNIEDSENILIKLCIVLSCSDVASGYNDELLNNNTDSAINIKQNVINGITVSEKTHQSNGAAWVNFKLRENHPFIIEYVLNELKPKDNESNLKDNESNLKDNESNLKDNESNLKDNESNLKNNESNLKDNESNLKNNESNLKNNELKITGGNKRKINTKRKSKKSKKCNKCSKKKCKCSGLRKTKKI
jgi:hypothetical protein